VSGLSDTRTVTSAAPASPPALRGGTSVRAVVLLATAPAADGGPAALLPWENGTVLARLVDQVADLGVPRAVVITRPAWESEIRTALTRARAAVEVETTPAVQDDLHVVARLAGGEGDGGLVVMYGDIVTHTQALAGLLDREPPERLEQRLPVREVAVDGRARDARGVGDRVGPADARRVLGGERREAEPLRRLLLPAAQPDDRSVEGVAVLSAPREQGGGQRDDQQGAGAHPPLDGSGRRATVSHSPWQRPRSLPRTESWSTSTVPCASGSAIASTRCLTCSHSTTSRRRS